jgi:hypothetical protein
MGAGVESPRYWMLGDGRKGWVSPYIATPSRPEAPPRAEDAGHTAWFSDMAKFRPMASPASARLKAPCLAASIGGEKWDRKQETQGSGVGAAAASTRKASTRGAWTSLTWRTGTCVRPQSG